MIETQVRDIAPARIKKVAIVGLPNTGKSQTFNNLTGEYTIVANYPGTTMETKRTITRINGQGYEIIDTPGLHCLYIHSEEETAVRDMILEERPDVIVQCIDAVQYRQSLMLTADLLELETPMVIVLNAVDEAARSGVWVDANDLKKILGVPVVESIAMRGLGKEELKNAILDARKSTLDVKYGFEVESAIVNLASALPFDLEFKHKIAILLLLNDPFIEKYIEKKYGPKETARARAGVNKIRRYLKDNIRNTVNGRRSQWIDEVSSAAVRKQKLVLKGFSHYFTQASRHPVLGIPILLFFMSIVYLSVVYISGAIDKFLNASLVKPVLGLVTSIALPRFWNDFLIGSHGIITLGIFNAICTVLPILSVFFFIFGFFEDSGYIANFCVLSKRIFEKIGVTGKAITSLVLGFGCKTMATLNTRGLTNRKEKLITVFLIAFAIPCSAQLGIDIAILGKVGVTACFIAMGALAVFEVGAGVIMSAVVKDDPDSYFIQVLPAMRFPDIKAVLIKTYHRIVVFLKEAMPIFIISAVFLFAVDKAGILDASKKVMGPIMVSWMGLPRDMVDVFILGLARREAAAGLIFQMADRGALNYVQSIVAVVVTTTFFPCFANVIAIGKEMGVKTAILISSVICVTSFILAGALRWILVFMM